MVEGTEKIALKKKSKGIVPHVERRALQRVYRAKADIFESPDNVVLIADMPGVDERSVDITLERSTLTIRGSAHGLRHEGRNLIYGEYETGNYERGFVLSEAVDREGIKAKIQNGVLVVILPKSAAVKGQKIEVKAA